MVFSWPIKLLFSCRPRSLSLGDYTARMQDGTAKAAATAIQTVRVAYAGGDAAAEVVGPSHCGPGRDLPPGSPQLFSKYRMETATIVTKYT